VHDEIVLEVPEEQGDTAKAAMVEELTRVPEWAGGLPIACEVSISQRYRKG
jgi:DNA polymerase I-like protein with 3'-5' exonuclease and polymerase domains